MNNEYAQYLAVDFLCHILPRRFSYWLAMRVADGFFRRDEKGRNAVMSNLRHIHAHRGIQLPEDRLEELTRETFRNFGKYLADFFRFTRVSVNEISRLVRVVHPEYIGQAAGLGKGVLVVTAHLGSWEIGGAILASFGYPVNVVVLPMKDKRTNALFQSRRGKRGLKVIPLGHTVRGIYSALLRKELVALLGDRDYSPRHHEVAFFGAPARLPIGPAKLCIATGAPILPGFLIRQPDDTFVLRIHPPISGEGLSLAEAQGRMVGVLEDEISQNPSQWFLFDEFWKGDGAPARPPSERNAPALRSPAGEAG